MSDKSDSREYFNMFDGENLIGKVPLSWKKKHLSMSVLIAQKVINCTECKNNFLCDKCDRLVNKTKKFWATLCELKRHSPDESGYMVPW